MQWKTWRRQSTRVTSLLRMPTSAQGIRYFRRHAGISRVHHCDHTHISPPSLNASLIPSSNGSSILHHSPKRHVVYTLMSKEQQNISVLWKFRVLDLGGKKPHYLCLMFHRSAILTKKMQKAPGLTWKNWCNAINHRQHQRLQQSASQQRPVRIIRPPNNGSCMTVCKACSNVYLSSNGSSIHP